MKKTIVIGGAAGEGINTAAQFIEEAVKKNGYYFLAYKNYMSRVRGGYNYTTITISDQPLMSISHKADLYLALNQESTDHAINQIRDVGIVVTTEIVNEKEGNQRVISLYSDALKDLKHKNAGTMAGVGAVLAYLGIGESYSDHLVKDKWSEEINHKNTLASMMGYEALKDHCEHTTEHPDNDLGQHIVITGNEAVALGAMAAGVSFYSAYPMAPSTGIMTFLAKNQEVAHILVEQAEDEIAAIMSAIGASSNGVRAMTSTSGGGFSLMVEALGFAAIAEVPLVVCNVQRPGPATGLPTRTEQADLLFMTFASQGEFARIVLAPTSIEDAFYTTFRAFELADRFQVPVMILSDQYLADSSLVTPAFEVEDLKINRYIDRSKVANYKRYDLNNISSGRKYPGLEKETLIMTDSHIHDEYGHVTEDAKATIDSKKKLMVREEAIKKALKAPEFVGVGDYTHLMIAWGSTGALLKSAVKTLNQKGLAVAGLVFSDVYPILPDWFDSYVSPEICLVNVEVNASNQFGKLIRMETGISFKHSINKYDGRPLTDEEIVEAMEVIYHG